MRRTAEELKVDEREEVEASKPAKGPSKKIGASKSGKKKVGASKSSKSKN